MTKTTQKILAVLVTVLLTTGIILMAIYWSFYALSFIAVMAIIAPVALCEAFNNRPS